MKKIRMDNIKEREEMMQKLGLKPISSLFSSEHVKGEKRSTKRSQKKLQKGKETPAVPVRFSLRLRKS